jgi:hypothetical protein
VLGNFEPVWMTDPRDAQYLNSTVEEMQKDIRDQAAAGLLVLSSDGEFAAATPKLVEHAEMYRHKLEEALAATKPAFNEEMRAGHTNM